MDRRQELSAIEVVIPFERAEAQVEGWILGIK